MKNFFGLLFKKKEESKEEHFLFCTFEMFFYFSLVKKFFFTLPVQVPENCKRKYFCMNLYLFQKVAEFVFVGFLTVTKKSYVYLF